MHRCHTPDNRVSNVVNEVSGLPGVTYAFTRVNDSIYVIVAKEKGRREHTTSTTTGVNARGKTVANIAVYNRQR